MHSNKTKPRPRQQQQQQQQGVLGRAYEGISSYFHDDSGILL